MYVLIVTVTYPVRENGKSRLREYRFYDPSFRYLMKLSNSLHDSCEPERSDVSVRYTINRINC